MKPSYVGGQALIEGVLMVTEKKIGIAVRKPNGKIVTKRQPRKINKYPVLKIPFVRGVIYLFEMLIVGMKALSWSADQQAEKEEELTAMQLTLTMLFSFALAVGLFIIAPYYLTKLTKTTGAMFNLIDGAIRLLIFVGYVWGISLFKDVKRLFQYHGAEHMAVHCYEKGKELTVKNVRRFAKEHERCGTALLFIVIIVSIIVFSLLKDPRWYVNLPLRIVLIPVIGGISYELLKLNARFKNKILYALVWPGLIVQKITTQKPDDGQIEVAIAAIKKVL